MNKIQLIIAVGAVLAMGLYGCGGKEAQLVGKWKGSGAASGSSGSNDIGAAFAKAMSGAMTVEFKPDKKFSMNMMIVPVEGTWSMSGNTVTLSPTSAMGMDMNQLKQQAQAQGGNMNGQDPSQPITMTLSDDGKTLTMASKNGQQAPFSFTKDTGT